MTAALEDRVTKIESELRVVKGGQRRLGDSVMALKRSVDDSNSMLVHNNEMTSEIREWMVNLKGFGNTVKWLGKTGKMIVMYLVLPFAAVSGFGYAAFHGGKFPGWWVQLVKFLFG